MKHGGVIERVLSILGDLMAGMVHDRHSIAHAYGIETAAADRYIRRLVGVTGVEAVRDGRRLSIRWQPRETGNGLCVSLSPQTARALSQLAEFGIYGITAGEVASRLIDQGLERFIAHPVIRLEAPAPRRKR